MANLRCMGTRLCLFTIFTSGNNFCDFLLTWIMYPSKKGSTLKVKNLLLQEQIFFALRVEPIENRGKMIVASPKSVTIHLIAMLRKLKVMCCSK